MLRNTDEAFQPIKVDSFDELMQHEQEILQRIERTPNGGLLFVTHPLMLLRDVGVELSERAQKEILDHEPHLSALSPTPYSAIKASTEQQPVEFRVHGLFERRST
jgi:hypothetical protein